MKKIVLTSFVVSFLLVPQLFAALVVEGKMESLNPILKSMRVVRTNPEGKIEHVEIQVPDGTPFSSPAHSLNALKVGDPVAVTVKIGDMPGEWVATEIKHLIDMKAVEDRKSPADPEIKKKAAARMKEMIAAVEEADKKRQGDKK